MFHLSAHVARRSLHAAHRSGPGSRNQASRFFHGTTTGLFRRSTRPNGSNNKPTRPTYKPPAGEGGNTVIRGEQKLAGGNPAGNGPAGGAKPGGGGTSLLPVAIAGVTAAAAVWMIYKFQGPIVSLLENNPPQQTRMQKLEESLKDENSSPDDVMRSLGIDVAKAPPSPELVSVIPIVAEFIEAETTPSPLFGKPVIAPSSEPLSDEKDSASHDACAMTEVATTNSEVDAEVACGECVSSASEEPASPESEKCTATTTTAPASSNNDVEVVVVDVKEDESKTSSDAVDTDADTNPNTDAATDIDSNTTTGDDVVQSHSEQNEDNDEIVSEVAEQGSDVNATSEVPSSDVPAVDEDDESSTSTDSTPCVVSAASVALQPKTEEGDEGKEEEETAKETAKETSEVVRQEEEEGAEQQQQEKEQEQQQEEEQKQHQDGGAGDVVDELARLEAQLLKRMVAQEEEYLLQLKESRVQKEAVEAQYAAHVKHLTREYESKVNEINANATQRCEETEEELRRTADTILGAKFQEMNAKYELKLGELRLKEAEAAEINATNRMGALKDVEGRIQQLEVTTNDRDGLDRKQKAALGLCVSVMSLRDALEGGNTFVGAVDSIRNGPSGKYSSSIAETVDLTVSSLSPAAIKRGRVCTLGDLRHRFHKVRAIARRESFLPEDGGNVASKGWATVLDTVTFSSEGMVPGNSADAVLARAAAFLDKGNLQGALQEVEKLDGRAADVVVDWVVDGKDLLVMTQGAKVLEGICGHLVKSL
eukprot:TRINITY_DN6418_c0_g1_i1.p1 TRINITY_DN6418_c0_g1~~TRINITY_DN6418_c0_g1_i1.p1  ORF type:complete len:765 (-),score=216.48 TRINITY_DN6418_c0_g1_i1:15-2309(-)